MRSEITIHPQTIQVQSIQKSINNKQKQRKDIIKTKRCGYRELLNHRYCQYRYIFEIPDNISQKTLTSQMNCNSSSLNNTNLQSSSEIQEKSLEPDAIQNQSSRHWKSKKKEQKQSLLNDPTALDLYNEYRSYCSNNLMKNIKEGFIRFVISSNDIRKLEKMIDNKMNYQQMKRKLVHLKTLTSENKVIKTICKHQHMSILFKEFLENIEDAWLTNSKIKQKEQCLQLSKFLIKIIGLQEYIDIIEDYKK